MTRRGGIGCWWRGFPSGEKELLLHRKINMHMGLLPSYCEISSQLTVESRHA